jgi:hypothetical protein
MIRIAITAAAFYAVFTALLLVGVASARAETIHGALGKAYGAHDLDRAPQKARRHSPQGRDAKRRDHH